MDDAAEAAYEAQQQRNREAVALAKSQRSRVAISLLSATCLSLDDVAVTSAKTLRLQLRLLNHTHSAYGKHCLLQQILGTRWSVICCWTTSYPDIRARHEWIVDTG